MSLWNPYAFTPTGRPVAPAAPPALRVMGAPASVQQLSMAQAVFAQFAARARLSAVPNPTEIGCLSDESQYRIVVVGSVATMMLWPAGGDAPGDSGCGIYVEAYPSGATRELRYLLQPTGGYAAPGRPWRVKKLPSGGAPYHYGRSDPPGILGFYGAALDVTWHSQQGKSKNYLVRNDGWQVGRHGAVVALPLGMSGRISSILREIAAGPAKRYGAVLVEASEIKYVVYEPEPFDLSAEVVSPPPVASPVSVSLVRRVAARSEDLYESIVDVSTHPGGDRMLVSLARFVNPEPSPFPPWPDPRVDERGRHTHTGTVSRSASVVGRGYPGGYSMAIELDHVPVADPDITYQIEEYRRNGDAWTLSTTDQTKRAGTCVPPTYQVTHGFGPPIFDGAIKIDEQELLPFPSDVFTSGGPPGGGPGSWNKRVFTHNGTATLKARSSAVYDEITTVQRFTHGGAVATVRSFGAEDYSIDREVLVGINKSHYAVTTSGGNGQNITQHSNASYRSTFDERRRSEYGLQLGDRRFVLHKSYVSIAGNGSRILRSKFFHADELSHSESAEGMIGISVICEDRSLLAYDPFLRLTCYTEVKFDFVADFSATYQRSEFEEGTPTDETTSGSDCFLPDLAPIDATFVLECGGSILRIPIPAAPSTPEDPDALYLDRFVKVPNLRYAFLLPGPRPDSLLDAGYTKGMRRTVASGGAAVHLDPESGRDGIPLFEREALCFGTCMNASRTAQIEYATDPRTGGAVLLAKFGSRRAPLAFAIDHSGARPLGDVLSDVAIADITAIGSA